MDEGTPEFVRAGGVKQYFDPAQKKSAAEKVQAVVEKRKTSPQIEVDERCAEALRAHYLQEIRPYLDGYAGRRHRAACSAPASVWRRISVTCAPSCRWPPTTCCATWKRSARSAGSCWCSAACTCGCMAGCWCHVPLSFAFLVLTAVHAVLSLRY